MAAIVMTSAGAKPPGRTLGPQAAEHKNLKGRGTLALLMALAAISQLGIGIVLPALPVIADGVGMAANDAALLISTYLLGLALGQLIAGPLSDRFGRQTLLLTGLLAFALVGLGAACATGPMILFSLRVLQGAAASAPFAVGRAVARDLHDGPALVRVTALITMSAAVVPGVAPVLGGLLVDGVGWRGVFGFAAAAGAILLVIVAIRLPETNTSPLTVLDAGTVLRLYSGLLRDPKFTRNALSSTFMLAALYAFLAGSPLMLIGPEGLTPAEFGLIPLATSAAYILGGAAMLRVADRGVMRTGVLFTAWTMALVGCLFLLWAAWLGTLDTTHTVIGAFLYSLGLGALLPIGSAGAIIPFGEKAGSASAMLGALNMTGGALAGTVAGWGGGADTTYPMVMIICVGSALVIAPRSGRASSLSE